MFGCQINQTHECLYFAEKNNFSVPTLGLSKSDLTSCHTANLSISDVTCELDNDDVALWDTYGPGKPKRVGIFFGIRRRHQNSMCGWFFAWLSGTF